uniref:Uncharacterized protein n=1 Tax=Arundo donax TaxID=35708 RepID=A0A0A9CR08_ARUDO
MAVSDTMSIPMCDLRVQLAIYQQRILRKLHATK